MTEDERIILKEAIVHFDRATKLIEHVARKTEDWDAGADLESIEVKLGKLTEDLKHVIHHT